MKRVTLKITGMHCSSCAQGIELALKNNKGVKEAAVNLADKKAIVSYEGISEEEIKRIIKNRGYGAEE